MKDAVWDLHERKQTSNERGEVVNSVLPGTNQILSFLQVVQVSKSLASYDRRMGTSVLLNKPKHLLARFWVMSVFYLNLNDLIDWNLGEERLKGAIFLI